MYNSNKVDINSIDIAEELAVSDGLLEGKESFASAMMSKFCN